MERAVRQHLPGATVELIPLADGGDGTIDALECCLQKKIRSGSDSHGLWFEKHENIVLGPADEQVRAFWLSAGGIERDSSGVLELREEAALKEEAATASLESSTAIIELASASGIAHLRGRQLVPLDAHTKGVGELMEMARQSGHKSMILTVGGSASTDGGIGILSKLGARFADRNGDDVVSGGRGLAEIASIDLSGLSKWKNVDLQIATDVNSPLLGNTGAARVFSPQKGATEAEVEFLEVGMTHFANLMEETSGSKARFIAGSGAAGGVPFGLVCALGASIIPGFGWLSEVLSLETKVARADLVISAEGSLDSQSLGGKALGDLARLCQKYDTRFGIVPALLDETINWNDFGVDYVVPSAGPGKIAQLCDVESSVCQLLNQYVGRFSN